MSECVHQHLFIYLADTNFRAGNCLEEFRNIYSLLSAWFFSELQQTGRGEPLESNDMEQWRGDFIKLLFMQKKLPFTSMKISLFS